MARHSAPPFGSTCGPTGHRWVQMIFNPAVWVCSRALWPKHVWQWGCAADRIQARVCCIRCAVMCRQVAARVGGQCARSGDAGRVMRSRNRSQPHTVHAAGPLHSHHIPGGVGCIEHTHRVGRGGDGESHMCTFVSRRSLCACVGRVLSYCVVCPAHSACCV